MVTVDRAYRQLADVFADGLAEDKQMYKHLKYPDDSWHFRRRKREEEAEAAPNDNGEAQDKRNSAPDGAMTSASIGKSDSHSTSSANDAHLPTIPALAYDPNILARKSYTTETALKFFPDDALIVMTAMSERALIYMKEEFSHRTLVIYEANALREQREKNESNLTAYFVRSLLSEGRIVYPVTVRDKIEGFVTKIITKKGPTNVILTTTAINLHGENETRLLSIPTNDSQEQTKAIMRRLAQGKPQTVDFTPWHDLQRCLAQAKHRVVIPYAADLAEAIPPVAVRLRRDFRSILRLIEAHTVLHQHTRERNDHGCLVATETDYMAVRELVADLIADGVGATVSETIRETVEVVSEKDTGEGVTVKVVSEHLKLDRSSAHRRIQAARDKGYLVNLEEKRGRPARYAIQDPLPEDQELLPLSISSSVQHTAPEHNTSLHGVSAEKNSTLTDGVQMCTVTEKTEDEEAEELIDLVD